jgi:hypothetical protein
MIRYYGFLSHRLRGKLLPIIQKLLGCTQSAPTVHLTFADLILKNFNFNPLTCIICGSQMILSTISFGHASLPSLLENHRALALLQKC